MSTDFPTLSLDDILNGSKRAQRSLPICMRLDVLGEIQELEHKIKHLRDDDDDPRLVAGNNTSAAELADRIRELEAEADQFTIHLKLQALSKTEWAAKVDEFTEENGDGVAQLNMTGLVENILPKTLLSPAMNANQLTDFVSKLSDGQWEILMTSIFELNRRTVSVGKSLTASLAMKPKSEKRGPDAD